jgi:hypothetical protein
VNHPIHSDTIGQAFYTIKSLKYSFPVLLPADKGLADSLGVMAYPTVLVIDKDKKILFQGDLETAEAVVAKLLKIG